MDDDGEECLKHLDRIYFCHGSCDGDMKQLKYFKVPKRTKIYFYNEFDQEITVNEGQKILADLKEKRVVKPKSLFLPGDSCPEIILNYHS